MQNKEVWKPVKGFESCYEVSNLGHIKSLDRYVNTKYGSRILKGRILKLSNITGGYKSVSVSKNNKVETKRVHRLIASSFIPNPKNKPEVNHKNGIVSDNRVENLEWCTSKENTDHAYKTGLMLRQGGHPNAKKVMNTKTGEIFTYMLEASKQTNYSRSHFYSMLTGVRSNKTDFILI